MRVRVRVRVRVWDGLDPGEARTPRVRVEEKKCFKPGLEPSTIDHIDTYRTH